MGPASELSVQRSKRRRGLLLLLLGRVAFVASFVFWTIGAILQSFHYGSYAAAGNFGVGPARRELSVSEEGEIIWSAVLAGAALAGAAVPDKYDRASSHRVEKASLVVESENALASASSSSTAPNISMEVINAKSILQSTSSMFPNSTEEYRSSNRPQLIVHVGLPKTGTTYLQCSLCSQFNITEPILLRDNWVYLGTCPYETCEIDTFPEQFHYHSLRSFFHKANARRNASLTGSFQSSLERLSTRGRNGIIIFEGFHGLDDDHVRLLAQSLQPSFDVRILVAHRPLYEWLISKYNSVMKRSAILSHWPGTAMDDDSNAEMPQISTHLPHFDLDNRGFLTDIVRQVDQTGQHPTETVMRNFARHFAKVSVAPLHRISREAKQSTNLDGSSRPSIDPMLQHLFCDVTQGGTPAACEAVRSGVIGSNIPSNPSVSFNYDHLATAAFEAGMLWSSPDNRDPQSILSRDDVAHYVYKYQKKRLNRTASDFPLLCLPNATLDRLERLSLKVERHLFREAWTEYDEREHSEGFAKRVSSKTYCWIDANATLSDPTWIDFFRTTIKRRYKKQ